MTADDEGTARLAQARARHAQHEQRDAQDDARGRVGRLVAGMHRLDRVLGAGPSGALFAATHVRIGRSHTLIHVRTPPARDAATVEHAMREVRSWIRLEHPSVADVRDVIVDDDGSVYLVSERLEGELLPEYLARRSRLDPEHAVTLLAPVLDALALAHRHGLVHGALALESVLVARAGPRIETKLIDLGVARLAQLLGAPPPRGTLRAPEQAIGSAMAIGPATDVWALGALLYACVVGAPPLPADAEDAAIARGAFVPVEARRPDVPDAVVLALRRALARDPGHRFAHAGELRRALRDLELGGAAPARGPGAVRAWAGAAKLAGLGLVAAAAIGGVSVSGSLAPRDPPRERGEIASLVPAPRMPSKRSPRARHDEALRSDCWPITE